MKNQRLPWKTALVLMVGATLIGGAIAASPYIPNMTPHEWLAVLFTHWLATLGGLVGGGVSLIYLEAWREAHQQPLPYGSRRCAACDKWSPPDATQCVRCGVPLPEKPTETPV